MFQRKFGVLGEGFIQISPEVLLIKKIYLGKEGFMNAVVCWKGFQTLATFHTSDQVTLDYCIMLELC